jgi:hypothetical protein
MADRTQQKAGEPAPAAGADDQQVGVGRQLDQRLGRVPVLDHGALHVDSLDGLTDLVEQPLEQVLGLAADRLVELGLLLEGLGQLLLGRPAARGHGPARQALLRGEVQRRGQRLRVVGVHDLQGRQPQPRLVGRPGQRPERRGDASTPTTILATVHLHPPCDVKGGSHYAPARVLHVDPFGFAPT